MNTNKLYQLIVISVIFILPLIFLRRMVLANPWEKCCEPNSGQPGCRTYDPNTGWKGVCSLFQLTECYPGGNPWTQTWGACSVTCGSGTQSCTEVDGCGHTRSCGTRVCNLEPCPTNTQVPVLNPTLSPTLPPTPNSNPKCSLKSRGDANCDGVINRTDFEIWKQQYNSMVPPVPNENNSNFNCVEGNDTTYFVDLVDFEIWRRNTSER